MHVHVNYINVVFSPVSQQQKLLFLDEREKLLFNVFCLIVEIYNFIFNQKENR